MSGMRVLWLVQDRVRVTPPLLWGQSDGNCTKITSLRPTESIDPITVLDAPGSVFTTGWFPVRAASLSIRPTWLRH